jgi:hypothetical protein
MLQETDPWDEDGKPSFIDCDLTASHDEDPHPKAQVQEWVALSQYAAIGVTHLLWKIVPKSATRRRQKSNIAKSTRQCAPEYGIIGTVMHQRQGRWPSYRFSVAIQ